MKISQKIIGLLLLVGSFPSIGSNYGSVFDEMGLLTSSEKEQIETVLKSLPISHIHLADDFDGQRPHDFARKIYNEVLFFELPPGRNGLVIVYSVADNVFEIRSGTKWTHILEEDEKQLLINELLIPAFDNGRYAEGLLEALSRIKEYFIENNTFPMSDEVRNQELKFVDETDLLYHSISQEIEEYISNNKVTNEEHIIYIRNCTFKGEDFDPHYSPYHAEGASDLDDINYVYARQIYNVLFKDRLNRFQVSNREPPDLSLICIFEDELYLLTNWEQFLEVQPSPGEAHIRTLTDYLGWMYEDYVDVGRQEAGIKQILKKVVALSRKEIVPLRSEFKPPMFSLAWFNNPLRLAMAIFGFIVLLLLALGGVVMIRRRKAS